MNRALEKLYDLSFAIFNEDYEAVEKQLNDESVPINLSSPLVFKGKLLRDQALATYDGRMIRLFLECPRVDWRATNEFDFNQLNHFKNEYDDSVKEEAKVKENKKSVSLHIFGCNFAWLEKACPQEAQLVYDRIFEALKDEPEEVLEELVLDTWRSPKAFERALKYCRDVNKKFPCGTTLLCEIARNVSCKNFEVLSNVIALGADVNLADGHGMTPIMHCINTPELARLLIEHGADLNRLDAYDHSAFFYCHDKRFYLENYGYSEEVFKNELNSKGLDLMNLYYILEKYPEYEQTFLSKLPKHLSQMMLFAECKWLKHLKSKEAYEFLKNCISNQTSFPESYFNDFPELGRTAFENSNEFLHLAVELDQYHRWTELLLTRFEADPNSVIDGLPPFFKVYCGLNNVNSDRIVGLLLDAGADPCVKIDGCYFYQQKGFSFQGILNEWVFKLYRRGFDLFEPSPLTGKNVFDCAKDYMRVLLAPASFKIQVRKMTHQIFLQLLKGKIDWNASIDEDQNTLIHYLVSGLAQSNEKFTPTALHKIKNAQGIASLELLVKEGTKSFVFTNMRIDSVPELRLFEIIYEQYNGQGSFNSQFLKAFGAEFLLKVVEIDDSDFLKSYLQEKNFALERFLYPVLWWPSYPSISVAWIVALLDYGIPAYELCRFSLKPEVAPIIKEHLFKHRSDYNRLFFEFLRNHPKLWPGDFVRLFFANEHIQRLVKSNPLYLEKLDRFFFALSRCPEDVKLFLDLGVDPRRLVGSSILVERNSGWPDVVMWRLLRDRLGMKQEDFERILVLYDPEEDQPSWTADYATIDLIDTLDFDNGNGDYLYEIFTDAFDANYKDSQSNSDRCTIC